MSESGNRPESAGTAVVAEATVGADDAGRRLDVAVAALIGDSRSRAQTFIDAGAVTVDGRVVSKSHRLDAGERLRVLELVEEEPPPPPVVPIRHEDDHLAIVAKPADLVVHAGAGVRGATLVDALLAHGVDLAPGEDPGRPGIVHRLDRGTSGLLVVAKSPEAMVGLKAMFKVHAVDRAYWTLVEGWPDPPEATIDAPIRRSPRNRTTFTTGDDGRPARTHYRTLELLGDLAELDVTLETGRTHQVRVHLRAIGRPVAGDLTYAASPQIAKRLGLARQALHARRIAFTHPVTGAPLAVEEPLPDDLATARARAAGL